MTKQSDTVFEEKTLNTSDGEISYRYYPAAGDRVAVVLAGGAGGGYDSPAEGLYPFLAKQLQKRGIPVFRIEFKDAPNFKRDIFDLTELLKHLQQESYKFAIPVGHSKGGGVVVQVAVQYSGFVKGIITLSTQKAGAQDISMLPKEIKILMIHGLNDEKISPKATLDTYQKAKNPKQILLYEGADHNLVAAKNDLKQQLLEWLLQCVE
jgi:pimeloyl-ACP methyl ester carboxylesterase